MQWHTDKNGSVIYPEMPAIRNEYGETICHVSPYLENKEEICNLISSAPELLLSLERALNMINDLSPQLIKVHDEWTEQHDPKHDQASCTLCMIRNTIKKAKGE